MTAEASDLLAMMPFAMALGVEMLSASADNAVGRLEWSPERCTAGGLLHGGVLMSLADTVGAICAYLNLPDGATTVTTVTTASTTNLFSAVRDGSVTATAHPVHVGRSSIVVRTELVDDSGRLVAETTQSQAVLNR